MHTCVSSIVRSAGSSGSGGIGPERTLGGSTNIPNTRREFECRSQSPEIRRSNSYTAVLYLAVDFTVSLTGVEVTTPLSASFMFVEPDLSSSKLDFMLSDE